MSVFLFMILPTLLTGAVLHFLPGFPLWGRNLVEGLLKGPDAKENAGEQNGHADDHKQEAPVPGIGAAR